MIQVDLTEDQINDVITMIELHMNDRCCSLEECREPKAIIEKLGAALNRPATTIDRQARRNETLGTAHDLVRGLTHAATEFTSLPQYRRALIAEMLQQAKRLEAWIAEGSER